MTRLRIILTTLLLLTLVTEVRASRFSWSGWGWQQYLTRKQSRLVVGLSLSLHPPTVSEAGSNQPLSSLAVLMALSNPLAGGSGNNSTGQVNMTLALNSMAQGGSGNVALSSVTLGLSGNAPVASQSSSSGVTLSSIAMTLYLASSQNQENLNLSSITMALALNAPTASQSTSSNVNLVGMNMGLALNGLGVSGVAATVNPGSVALALALSNPASGETTNTTLSSITLALSFNALAKSATVNPGSIAMGLALNAVTASQSSVPGIPSGVTASNSPAQITVSWSAATGASTYDVYYALSSSASVIPANNDCTYLLETSYTSGLTAYPGTPNATAGVYTGVSGTSYTINGPLTSGSSYCVAVSGVNSGMVQGTLSGTTHAAAAAAHGTLTLTASTATLTGSGLSCGSGVSGTDANGSPIETFTCTASTALSFTYLAVGGGGGSDDDIANYGGDSSVTINGVVKLLADGGYSSTAQIGTTFYTGGPAGTTQGGQPSGGGGAGTAYNAGASPAGQGTSLGDGGAGDNTGGSDTGDGGNGGLLSSNGSNGDHGGAGGAGGPGSGDQNGDQNGGVGGNVAKIASASISSGQTLIISIGLGGTDTTDYQPTNGGNGSGYIVW